MIRRSVGTGALDASPVASPRQEALLAFDGRRVQVVLRTSFEAGPAEVAWVVPVPNRPRDIQPADAAFFEQLDRATAPRFLFASSKPKGMGCGCGGMAAKGEDRSFGVVVHETGRAGMLDYAVLSGPDGAELMRWLDANGYRVPATSEAPAIFGGYARQGWHFLAMKLSAEAREAAGTSGTARPGKPLAPQPISYVYEDDRLVYPMVISRISAAPRNEILLYVLAGRRYACANWENATMAGAQVQADPSSPSGTTYETLFRRKAESGPGHLFVTERAARLLTPARPEPRDPLAALALPRQPYVTRLRALIAPAAMDRDVVLTASPDAADVDGLFRVSGRAPRQAGGAATWAPAVLGLAAVLVPFACRGRGARCRRTRAPQRG